MLGFIGYVNPIYRAQWFHRVLCHFATQVSIGAIQRLIICMPPQHGKSEIFSRALPAFSFGLNPDLKVIHTARAADLVQGLNRDNQRTIDSPEYIRLFPDTRLNSANVRTVSGSWLRNNDMFEIVSRRGSYRCAGVGGIISGYPCDLGIADDLLKDYKEALSPTVRRTVWEWFTGTFMARMREHSRQLVVMTRYHPEDPIGMLVGLQPEHWRIITLPALCEDPDAELQLWREVEPDATRPPRELGDALWPEQFSREFLLMKRELNPHQFDGLYQQRPKAREGNLFKYDDLCSPEHRLAVRFAGRDVRRVRGWDLAGTMRPGGDRTSGSLGALAGDRRFAVENVVYGRWNVHERNERILATARRDRADAIAGGWEEPRIAIETPIGVNAEGMQNELSRKLMGFPFYFVPARGSKVIRAEPLLGYAQAGNVYVYEGDPESDEGAWITDWVEEMTAFTGADNEKNDMVDSTTLAFSQCAIEHETIEIEFY